MSTVKKQSGAALILSLVILLILTILGVTALNTSTTQEVLVGNLQEAMVVDDCTESILKQLQAEFKNGLARRVDGSNVVLDEINPQEQQLRVDLSGVVCADSATAVFEFAGKQRKQPILKYPGGCMVNIYEVNVNVVSASGTQRAITSALALDPVDCT